LTITRTPIFQSETPDGPPAAPLSSFRIPKKSANAQPSPSSAGAGSVMGRATQSPSPSPSQHRKENSCRVEIDGKMKREWVKNLYFPVKDEPRGYTIGRPMKQEYKPAVDARSRCDFIVPRTLAIEMNGVNMDLSHAPEFVNRYHINITKVKRNDDEKDATRGPRQDLPSAQRKQALFALFGQVVSEHPEYFGENSWKHVYDLGNTFYSIGCKITENDGDVVFEMAPDEINCPQSRNFLSKGCKKLIITVQWTGKIYIKGPKQNEDDGSRREAARFFEILTSQSIFSNDHHVFANKFFEGRVDNDVKLGEGKCVKSGFEKNVRELALSLQLTIPADCPYYSFLGDTEENAVPVLQIDTKKSPFYRGQSVLDFIRELTDRNPDDALRNKAIRQKVARELRDLVVSTTHLEKNTWFYVHGIVESSARTQTFETDEGEISVEQYFKERYKRTLRYPDLPLATERKAGKGFSFFPLEVLCIERGQRVDNKKLAGKLTDRMIQQARMLPHEMRAHNSRQLEEANLIKCRNEYLAAFGVRTADSFVKSEAKVLCAPEIKYKSSSIQPDRGGTLQWRTNPSMQFYQPATVKNVSLVISI
ncbi:PAZ domain protein, partial [Cooperia oncophora]